MTRLIVLAFVGSLFCPVSLFAQVTPATDFFGGVSVLTIGGEATDGSRHTLVGWHFSGATTCWILRVRVRSASAPSSIGCRRAPAARGTPDSSG